ncbi:hypothetical protein [Arthrobacter sp. H14]|uniref:hypothetical protein n=1 Tax=Arthrobacter sp. H14 TaxID=1312959 RepID=UPI0004AF7C0A|nr:hypothetical protein [Arthrobacter sp. H14]
MTTSSTSRQPKGSAAGGQFARALRAEPMVHLNGTTAGPVPVNGMNVLGSPEAGYVDKIDDDGNLTAQVRLEDRKPNDSPDGTAAIISYTPRGTEESFYTKGVLHDGSGGTPSKRYTGIDGKTVITRGYRTAHRGSIVPQDSPDGQPASVVTHAVAEDDWREPTDGRVATTWMTAGHRQDPAPGFPAMSTEMADGGRKYLHFPDGREDDLEDGTPAEQHFDKYGNRIFQGRYYGGFPFDGDDGEPAFRKWRPDGTLEKEWRYCKGQLLDSADGKPAITEYAEDGRTVVKEEHRGIDNRWFGTRFEFERLQDRGPRAKEWPYKGVQKRHERGGS